MEHPTRTQDSMTIEQPTRMQDALPVFSERGVERIVAEKKLNPRSIPFMDGEFSQWYRVGNMHRGGFWRPYTVTVVVLECVLMMISLSFFVYTLFFANVGTNSVLGYYIMHRNLMAQQRTDAAAMVVRLFDVHLLYPHVWLVWLLLPAGISAIVFPLFAIMFLSGQERSILKWIIFSMHALSAFTLIPLVTEAITLELDLDMPAAYSIVQSNFNHKAQTRQESEFLRWWAWYASYYERKFMHFASEETLMRSLERDISCCGIENIDEYWQQADFINVAFLKFHPPLQPEALSHYIQKDWQNAVNKAEDRFFAYPPSCCDNCELNIPKGSTPELKLIKASQKKITIISPTCKSQMSDLRVTHLYPLYITTLLILFLNVLLCVFVGMSNFCKWVTEGVDEEKYLDEVRGGKIFHDKLRDRQRVLSEGANNIYNTAIRVDNRRNRLAIQTQITQYVPTQTRRRKKHWKAKV